MSNSKQCKGIAVPDLNKYHWTAIGAALGVLVGFHIDHLEVAIAIGAGVGYMVGIYYPQSSA